MAEKKDEKKEEKKEVTPEEEASKSKKKRLLIIIIGGGLFIAIAAGAAFFMLASGGKDPGKGGEGSSEHEPADTKSEHGSEKKEEKSGDGKKDSPEHGASEKKAGDQGKDAASQPKKEGEAGKGAEGTKEAPKKDDKKSGDKKIDGVDFGCTMPLGPFHLNLGNPLENRYIRIDLAVEYGCAEEQKAELEKRTPQLKNAVIAVTTRKTREFLLGPDGKEQLRKEILNRVNHFMTKKIEDIYITEIIIE